MTATLTDRYVWAVLRAVPSGQRPDLEPEIRALIADTIDATAGDERAALVELGDPDQLAARYTDRQRYLIGPVVYPEWYRLVSTLVAILVPVIAIVSFGASMLAEQPIGQAIVGGLGSAFMVAVQTVFWVTLVFVAIERTTKGGATLVSTGAPWTPDALPELPDAGRMGIGEMAGTVVANLFLIGAIVWLQVASPINLAGTTYPLFDPALWSFWLPYFIVIAFLEIAFAVVLWLRGRWTYGFAVINALLGAAFAIPAIWLVTNGMLFNPALVDAVSAEAPGDWMRITATITVVAIGAIVAWDAVDGFLKARRASQPALPVA